MPPRPVCAPVHGGACSFPLSSEAFRMHSIALPFGLHNGNSCITVWRLASEAKVPAEWVSPEASLLDLQAATFPLGSPRVFPL